MIKVLIAGATGWAGSELTRGLYRGIYKGVRVRLVGALSQKHKSGNLADILHLKNAEIPVFEDIETALAETDFEILIDYTRPEISKKNIIAALKKGKKVIIGTSGFTDEDYTEIEKTANENNTSALVVGNFAIDVVLPEKFTDVAWYISDSELIDYAHKEKTDGSGGTLGRFAHQLSQIQNPIVDDKVIGKKARRGARKDGVQADSTGLPEHVISIESIFRLKDENIIIRHDSGASAEVCAYTALVAIDKVKTFKGLKRGMDTDSYGFLDIS